MELLRNFLSLAHSILLTTVRARIIVKAEAMHLRIGWKLAFFSVDKGKLLLDSQHGRQQACGFCTPTSSPVLCRHHPSGCLHAGLLVQTLKVEGFAHKAAPTPPVTSIVSPGHPQVCPAWLQTEGPTIPSLNSVLCWDSSWKSAKHFTYHYCFLGEDIVKNTSEQSDAEVPGARASGLGCAPPTCGCVHQL